MDNCTCGCGCGPEVAGARSGAATQGAQADAAAISLGDDRGAVSRRGVLAGSAAALAALALAACAGTDETGAEGTASPEEPGSPDASTPSEAESESESESEGGSAGEVLATTSEFPVGGGKVVTVGGSVVVVTQPDDGQFVAFNGTCPHQGCPVAEVTENTILCTCHGSTFDGSNGERLEGPAPRGLEPVAITVEGDSIRLA